MAISTTLHHYICNADVQNMLLLVLFCIGLWFYLNLIWNKRYQLIKSWNMPGPFNFPIIGSAYLLLHRRKHCLDGLVDLQKKYPTGGKAWFGYILFYTLSEPRHIKTILANPKYVTKEIVIYDEIKECMGEGIFAAPTEKWRRHRQTILPSFNQKILNSFVGKFAEKSLILAEILSGNCGNELDLENCLANYALDAICATAMGVDLDAQKTNTEYAHTIEKTIPFGLTKAWAKYLFGDFYGYDKKELRTHIKKLNDISLQVIQKKMESNNNSDMSYDYSEKAPFKHLSFLDHIIESGTFNADELKDEVTTILIAATDTSSATLTFLFIVLGMFPEIQQKVYEEIIEILGNDRSPAYDELNQMVYTERVIKETLRVFPVGPFFARMVTEDVDMGEFIVPKCAIVFFGLLFIHRNPKYWPDPLKFDPDRFLPEEVAKRHPCTYIPFSFGPRNCIGKKYGLMNIKVVLSTIIRKFRIQCEYTRIEDIKFDSEFILRPRDGAKVSMTPRI